jgi:hypothetical protein
VRGVCHHHEAADSRYLVHQRLDQGHEAQVEKQPLILGVVDDVLDLLGEQARIDGMQHRAHTRNAVVQLHVTIAIPGQGGDTIPCSDTPRSQGIGQLPGAAVDIAIGATM